MQLFKRILKNKEKGYNSNLWTDRSNIMKISDFI